MDFESKETLTKLSKYFSCFSCIKFRTLARTLWTFNFFFIFLIYGHWTYTIFKPSILDKKKWDWCIQNYIPIYKGCILPIYQGCILPIYQGCILPIYQGCILPIKYNPVIGSPFSINSNSRLMYCGTHLFSFLQGW